MPTRTLTAPFFAVFNADTLAAKQGWKAANGTHVVVAARWSDLEPGASAPGTLDSTALAALKTQFADAAAARLGVILSFSTHYTPAWIKSGAGAAPRFKAQDGSEWTSSNALGDDVVDAVFSSVARTAIAAFQQRVWDALTVSEKAQVKGFRIGGGAYGELHYPTPGATPKWWGYSAPAQAGTGLASGMVACPVPGHVPFQAYSSGGQLSVNAYGIETSAAAWESAAAGVTVARDTTQFAEGAASLNITRASGTLLAQARLVAAERIAVSVGSSVTARAQMRNATAGRNGAVGIEWYDSGGALLSTSWGSTTAISSTEWREVTVTAAAPASTVKYGVIAGLAPDQASSSQPFLLDKVNAYTGANADVQFTEWYLDAMNRYMLWQVERLRTLGFDGSIHVLHPSFGLRSNHTFGSANYVTQAAEGVDYARQVAAYPDAEVWPQCTWTNAEDPIPASAIDSDQAPWRKLLALATTHGRTALLAGENTGGSDPNWDNDADIDRMFGVDGAYDTGRYVGLTWLNWPRLSGEVSGTHATLSRLSQEMPAAVAALSIRTRRQGDGDPPADVNALVAKINEIAIEVGAAPISVPVRAAGIGARDLFRQDMNAILAKVDALATALSVATTGLSAWPTGYSLNEEHVRLNILAAKVNQLAAAA